MSPLAALPRQPGLSSLDKFEEIGVPLIVFAFIALIVSVFLWRRRAEQQLRAKKATRVRESMFSSCSECIIPYSVGDASGVMPAQLMSAHATLL